MPVQYIIKTDLFVWYISFPNITRSVFTIKFIHRSEKKNRKEEEDYILYKS